MLVTSLSANSDEVTISIETGFTNQILDEVCSDIEIDETEVRQSVVVKNMLAHFVRFRPDFTMENYINARKAAAHCSTVEADIFRFRDVIKRRAELKDEIDAIGKLQPHYSEQAATMVRALSPNNMGYSGSATLMIGTPSVARFESSFTGWIRTSKYQMVI